MDRTPSSRETVLLYSLFFVLFLAIVAAIIGFTTFLIAPLYAVTA